MRQLLLLFDPYFADEELEAESFTNLPAVTALVSSRTRIRTKMAQGWGWWGPIMILIDFCTFLLADLLMIS